MTGLMGSEASWYTTTGSCRPEVLNLLWIVQVYLLVGQKTNNKPNNKIGREYTTWDDQPNTVHVCSGTVLSKEDLMPDRFFKIEGTQPQTLYGKK
jgi:hypothetical protein